ncbi:MAG: nicotinate phosphoribosyltransferase [Thermodesulfobacteriota bacterium]
MIVTSLLDTDLYKFTMGQAVFLRYPEATACFHFRCRNGSGLPRGREDAFLADLGEEIRAFCSLGLTNQELAFLRGLGLFSEPFLEWMRLSRPNPDHVRFGKSPEGSLALTVEGPWFAAIYFEVPLLAIINELYIRHALDGEPDLAEARARLARKIDRIRTYNAESAYGPLSFVNFGTRRRASFAWEEEVHRTLVQALPGSFTGTSNLHFAMKLGIRPMGTMAHEWVQAHQQLGGSLEKHQQAAFETWAGVYRGKLGIAISDTVGMEAFLRNFDGYLARLFDGCRQDSGDPFAWTDRLLGHYRALGLDPGTKTAVYSDGLDVETMIRIHRHVAGRMRTAFGIGTNLTNDIGLAAQDIVIKMVSLNGRPTAKISDSPGKGMCDDETFLAYMRSVFGIAP